MGATEPFRGLCFQWEGNIQAICQFLPTESVRKFTYTRIAWIVSKPRVRTTFRLHNRTFPINKLLQVRLKVAETRLDRDHSLSNSDQTSWSQNLYCLINYRDGKTKTKVSRRSTAVGLPIRNPFERPAALWRSTVINLQFWWSSDAGEMKTITTPINLLLLL